MASLKEITDRMRAEGDLIRNSGTNSLKSVKDVLSDMTLRIVSSLDDIGYIMIESLDETKRFFEYLQNQRLQEEENRRELIDVLEKQREDARMDRARSHRGGDSDDSSVSQLVGRTAMIMGIIASLSTSVGLLGGFATELLSKTRFTGFEKLMKGIRAMSKWFSSIADKLADARHWVSSQLSKFTGAVKQIFLNMFDDVIRAWRDVKALFGATGKGGGLVSSIVNFIGRMLGVVEGVAKAFTSAARVFLNFGKAIGRLLGKLAIPITVIMSAFEGVRGAIEGFKTDGVFGALRDGFKGVLDVLIGWAFDLPISIAKWFYRKIGQEDWAKSLEGVSFSAVFDGLIDFIAQAMNWVVEKFDSMVEYFSPDNVLKNISTTMSRLGTFLTDDLPKAILRVVMTMIGQISPLLMASALKIPAIKRIADEIGYGEDSEEIQRSKSRGVYRDPAILERATQSGEVQGSMREQLQKTYGFTDNEIDRALALRTAQSMNEGARSEEQRAIVDAQAAQIISVGSSGNQRPIAQPSVSTTNFNNVNIPDRLSIVMASGFAY